MTRWFIALAALLAASAQPDEDAFDRAEAALAAGEHATESGDRAQLRAAALALRASAALPIVGDDMAAVWLHAGHAAPPPPERDRVLGPGYRALRLAAGATATFEQTFLAGQRARVAVVPVRGSNFSMRVSDGRTLLCDAAPDRARCDWVPSYTTRFTIAIVNPGANQGQYYVMMQ